MKTTGIVRQIDSLGRIVLPIEMRNRLDLTPRSEVEIFFENNSIVLRKYQPSCIFCGSGEKLVEFDGKRVCHKCIDKLGKKVNN